MKDKEKKRKLINCLICLLQSLIFVRERQVELLAKWRTKGGVFLIGYIAFRNLSVGKHVKDRLMARDICHALQVIAIIFSNTMKFLLIKFNMVNLTCGVGCVVNQDYYLISLEIATLLENWI